MHVCVAIIVTVLSTQQMFIIVLPGHACLCLHSCKHHWLSELQVSSFITHTEIPHPTLLAPWPKVPPQSRSTSDVAVCLHGSNAEGTSCQLFWDGEHVLYMGWHHTIKVSCKDSHAFIGCSSILHDHVQHVHCCQCLHYGPTCTLDTALHALLIQHTAAPSCTSLTTCVLLLCMPWC